MITTDGVNTVPTTGATFRVAAKPPSMFIQAPTSDSTYALGDTVMLRGAVYDLQEGWLTSDAALTWSSSRDGVLGTGGALKLENLTSGRHTITLSAVNSLGLTTSASVSIRVGDAIYLPLIQR